MQKTAFLYEKTTRTITPNITQKTAFIKCERLQYLSYLKDIIYIWKTIRPITTNSTFNNNTMLFSDLLTILNAFLRHMNDTVRKGAMMRIIISLSTLYSPSNIWAYQLCAYTKAYDHTNTAYNQVYWYTNTAHHQAYEHINFVPTPKHRY